MTLTLVTAFWTTIWMAKIAKARLAGASWAGAVCFAKIAAKQHAGATWYAKGAAA